MLRKPLPSEEKVEGRRRFLKGIGALAAAPIVLGRDTEEQKPVDPEAFSATNAEGLDLSAMATCCTGFVALDRR